MTVAYVGEMQVLRSRWFWIWTAATEIVLILALVGDFMLFGIGWLTWSEAAVGAPVLGALIGLGLGWFNVRRAPSELWLISGVVAVGLFSLVLIQYAVVIVVTPGECGPPEVVNNCFDEHSAAIGNMAAFGGSLVLATVLGIAAITGAELRRRLMHAQR